MWIFEQKSRDVENLIVCPMKELIVSGDFASDRGGYPNNLISYNRISPKLGVV